MTRAAACTVLLVIACVLGVAPARAGADKLIVVTTSGWAATTGTLQRYEGVPGAWKLVGEPVPVVVGKGGLGWGLGLAGRPAGVAGPDKREGDGRAPAGRFALGEVTGYDERPPAGLALPYRTATDTLRCVDDAEAADYNRLAEAPGSWRSDERMRRDDELYRLTVFVRQNPVREPGRGSCIFLHVWRDAAAPTVGCTAMALPGLREVAVWADAETQLVQLPRPVHASLRAAWRLP